MARKEGAYAFVAPSGQQSVRLLSRRGSRHGPDLAVRSDQDRFGLKVHDISIGSDAGNLVIAADDARLTTGWYAAEQAGLTVWRWTNGSAELPWRGVAGPVVVTIHCDTLPECAFVAEYH